MILCLCLRRWRTLSLCTLSLVGGLNAAEPRVDDGYAPVTVSAAHYRNLSREQLRAKVNAQPQVLADAPARTSASQSESAAAPVYYIFAPGEGDGQAMPYEAVCALLEPALAQRGFLNAADQAGQLQRPMEEVPLVLRVSYGTIPWRLPIVRTEQLQWRHGLRPKRARAPAGAEVAYDHRYGGTVDVNRVTMAAPRSERMLEDFASTRLHHLICVDAFFYGELQEKGAGATRVWTTFLSAPMRRGTTFAQLAPIMIRAGAGAFGETTTGLLVHRDAQAEVHIGEAEVIED